MSVNEILTNKEEGIEGVSLDIDLLVQQAPVSLGEKVRVLTRREQKELAKKAQKKKALRHRKAYTRKPGHVHPKKKEATARRRYKNKWSTNPFGCLIHGWGAYAVDREKWDEYVQPFFNLYEAADLSIVRYGKPWGSRDKPHTVYSFDLVHKKLGTLYCGGSQELYDLSKPSNG